MQGARIKGEVTISLQDFEALQKEAERAEKLEVEMKKFREDATDMISFDESEMKLIFKEIDESNMTDKQISKRYDEAIAKLKMIVDPDKLKRFLRKYIDESASDSCADLTNTDEKVLKKIKIELKEE